MSTVEAHVGVARASARAAVSAPPWAWVAIAGGVALAVWAYCRTADAESPDWLDPNQPPLSVPVDFSTKLLGLQDTVPGQDTGGFRREKKYPWVSLMTHPCCWVGDC